MTKPGPGFVLRLACGCTFYYPAGVTRPKEQTWCSRHTGMWPVHRKPLIQRPLD